jgi:F0F1-type ATP synthase assembly protein I
MSNEAEKKPQLYNYARYSGLAFQMIAIILLAVFGGIRLDRYLESSRPWFTALFSVAGVALAIYFAIKDLIRK